MSLIDTVMLHDRKLRHLFNELGLEYDEVNPLVASVAIPKAADPDAPKFTRRGWTHDDYNTLRLMTDRGLENKVIAQLLSRTTKAITSAKNRMRHGTEKFSD